MKIKALWVLVSMMALTIAFGMFATPDNIKVTEKNVVDSIVFDTVTYYVPVPKDSTVIKYKTVKLPVASPQTKPDTVREVVIDSVYVDLPYIRKNYEDSTYKAVVSGYYDVSLDAISVYPKTIYRTRTITSKPDKWHLGVQAGYGMSKDGLSPFVGVGVSYSIFSW